LVREHNEVRVSKGRSSIKLKLYDNDNRRLDFLEATMGITRRDDLIRYCIAQVSAIVSASQAETLSTMSKTVQDQHEKPTTGAYGFG
jgi:hypothetical protein